MSESHNEWFAVHTRYQHERAVSSVLKAKGFQSFLPMYREVRCWADRKKVVWLPLFPGYLFVGDACARRIEILSVPGVCAIVSFQGVPAAIPGEEIEAVQRIIACPENLRPHPFLKNGDRVKVVAGPLAGVQGVMVEEKDEYHLVISIQIPGRSAAVAMDRFCVVPVSPTALVSREPEITRFDRSGQNRPCPEPSPRYA